MSNLQKIKQEFERAPWEFSLHQFMSLLELTSNEKKEFGSGKSPSEEPSILKAYCSFSAPSSDCIEFKTKNGQNYLTINQTSLIGINGILPQRYSEKIITKSKEGNFSLLDFINIFNQRYFGLMHKIEKRTQLNLSKNWMNNFEYCNAISGMQNNKITKKYQTILPSFAGFLWQKNKSPNGLVDIIKAVFPKFHIEIEQFVPEWIDINEDCKSYLNRDPLKNKMLGRRALCMQRSIKIIIMVYSKTSYDSILPGTENFDMIKNIAQYYCPPAFKIKFEFKLPREVKPNCELTKEKKLGYNTWLGSNRRYFGNQVQ